jgi:hypothetical protein
MLRVVPRVGPSTSKLRKCRNEAMTPYFSDAATSLAAVVMLLQGNGRKPISQGSANLS